MKIKQSLLIIGILLFPLYGFAGTTFNLYTNDAVMGPYTDISSYTDFANQLSSFPQLFIEKNKDFTATGFALANPLGYPNGKNTIKKFPHFEAGIAVGASIYDFSRINDFNTETNPTVPGIGANAGVHFGTGITDNFDLTVKFFTIGLFYTYSNDIQQSIQGKPINFNFTRNDITSFGIKGRYKLLPRIKVMPYVFSFGGISVNLSLDYLSTDFRMEASYNNADSISLNLTDPLDSSNTENDKPTSIQSQLSGKGTVMSKFFSVTPEILVYADFFYAITLYTGPSLTINMGHMDINLDIEGDVKNTDNVTINSPLSGGDLILIPANQTIASAVLLSDNRLIPAWFTPRWIIGMEINIVMVKIQVEAAIELASLVHVKEFSDIAATVQVGIRVDL